MKERCAIYTCSDAGYEVGTAALLRSVARVYPAVDRYCFVPESQLEEMKGRIGEIATVLPAPRPLKNVPEQRQMMAARVFGVTLPADIVVYMDSDIVVCRPGPDLWQVEGKDVRAVMDPAKEMFYNLYGGEAYWNKFKERFPERVGYNGINSGVFALRPAFWQALPDLFEEAIDGFDWVETAHFADQPFLGAIFLPYVKPLPFSYNVHFSFEIPVPCNVRNMHYTGIKPWNPSFPHHERPWFYWIKYGSHPACSYWQVFRAFLWVVLNEPRCAWSRIKKRSVHDARVVVENPCYAGGGQR